MSDPQQGDFADEQPGDIAEAINNIEQTLIDNLNDIYFPRHVTHVYNPLDYASEPHMLYNSRYGDSKKQVLFLGMNPGPFGMAQTGVPFGNVPIVRDWMGITGEVRKPSVEHPRRRVQGFDCKRNEVSGLRFWTLIRNLCGTPEAFFRNAFVYNYFPLLLLGSPHKNITPAKLHPQLLRVLDKHCFSALEHIVELLQVHCIVAIGHFALVRAESLIEKEEFSHIKVVNIMHPSPANQQARLDWTGETLDILRRSDVVKYLKDDKDDSH